jgi:hypothetical protein
VLSKKPAAEDTPKGHAEHNLLHRLDSVHEPLAHPPREAQEIHVRRGDSVRNKVSTFREPWRRRLFHAGRAARVRSECAADRSRLSPRRDASRSASRRARSERGLTARDPRGRAEWPSACRSALGCISVGTPSAPHRSRAEASGCARVASHVLGPADRLAVRVAEMPRFSGRDDPADELAVDVLAPSAGGTPSAAHEPGGDGRCPRPAAPAVVRRGVLLTVIVDGSLAARAAEALIRGPGHELASAAGAVALTIRDLSRHPRSPAESASFRSSILSFAAASGTSPRTSAMNRSASSRRLYLVLARSATTPPPAVPA